MKEEFKASINQISKGVHSDFIEEYQPEGTMRSSMNGEIISYEEGFYQWSNLKGDTRIIQLNQNEYVISWCNIKNVLYIITFHQLQDNVYISKLDITNNGTSSARTVLHTYPNSEFNYSSDHPIRRIIGFYESETVQNIYLTDFYNPPKVINIAKNQVNSKFLVWSPIVDKMGIFKFNSLGPTGNANYGNYFFTWRLYTENGYYTDWSYLTNPVQVSSGTIGNTYDDYQNYQGDDPSKNSGKSIDFQIIDIDVDYKGIEIAYFYTDTFNNSGTGKIFTRQEITSSSITVSLKGNESINEILIDDLVINSITINKVKDFDVIKNINVLGNIEEREELDLPDTINVDITEQNYRILLDTKPIADVQSETYQKALFGVLNIDSYHATKIMLPNVIYKSSGSVFNGDLKLNLFGKYMIFNHLQAYTSGTVVPVHLIKKYRKKDVELPSSNYNSYICEEIPLSGEFPDYKNPVVDNKLKGYPRNTKIRLGIVFWDLNGKPYFTRWLKDNTLNDDYKTKDHYLNSLLETGPLTINDDYQYSEYLSGNNVSLLISGLDITDIRDKISGFSIVRCPIEHEIISTGILTQIYQDTRSYTQTQFNTESLNINSRMLNSYSYYSPEQLFEFDNFSIKKGDLIKNLIYLKSYLTISSPGTIEGVTHRYYDKFLIEDNTIGFSVPEKNSSLRFENEIESSTNYEFGNIDLIFNPLKPEKPLYNYSARQAGSRRGQNSKHIVLNTKNEETYLDPIGIYNNTRSTALLVGIKRPNNNPYGGTSKSALANSKYIFCGHYQEINDTVLSDVLQSNGRYIFNEIQIFGGDTYVQLFDLQRLYNDIDGVDMISQSIVFPVETRINLSLRTGNHIAKNRSFYPTINPDGIKYGHGSLDNKTEDFFYNTGYSSDNIGDFYPALPDFTIIENKFPTMIRWSLQKSVGEMFDKFRIFHTNSFKILESRYGNITNIRKLKDYIVYWTPESVGYLPVLERQLSSTELGAPIQMGVGGVLERSDELSVFGYGNSHQFSLVESEIGFHWFNILNKTFISLNSSMKLDQNSLAAGLNNYFDKNILDELYTNDNPDIGKSIVSGYYMTKKKIYMTFLQSTGSFTVMYDIKLNMFIGNRTGTAINYIFNNKYFLATSLRQVTHYLVNSIYVMENNSMNSYHDNAENAYVELIVNDEQMLSKIFNDIILKDNSNNFSSITFTSSNGTVTEIITEGRNNVLINKNYKRIREELRASIPKLTTRERLNGSFLSIKFMVSSFNYDVRVSLKKLITYYKTAY